MARLCVYCIISSLETRSQSLAANNFSQKKRSRSHDDIDDHELSSVTKMRKLTAADGSSDNSCSNDFLADNCSMLLGSNSMAANFGSMLSHNMRGDTSMHHMSDSLQYAVQHIFQLCQQFVNTDELSPRIYFVYQFISLLVECGKERVKPVLKLLPINLISNLLKVMLTDDISTGLIARLYDLRMPTSRQSAISDLCLWRNLKLKQQNIQL